MIFMFHVCSLVKIQFFMFLLSYMQNQTHPFISALQSNMQTTTIYVNENTTYMYYEWCSSDHDANPMELPIMSRHFSSDPSGP